jgi:hypothetical protein
MEDQVLQRTNELMQDVLMAGARWGTGFVNPQSHVWLNVTRSTNSLDGDNFEMYKIRFRAPLEQMKELTPKQKQDVKNGMRFPEPSFHVSEFSVYALSTDEERAQLEANARNFAFAWDDLLMPVKNWGCPRVSKNALSRKTIDLMKKLAAGGRCRAVHTNDRSSQSKTEAEAFANYLNSQWSS